MSRTRRLLMAVWLLLGAGALAQQQPSRGLTPDQLRSGLSFAGPDVQRLQADGFANPGLLWLTRGEALWSQAAGPQMKACQDCHGRQAESMRGVAARYPRLAPSTGRLVNLEDQIRACRTQRQLATDWVFESEELLNLRPTSRLAPRSTRVGRASSTCPARSVMTSSRVADCIRTD